MGHVDFALDTEVHIKTSIVLSKRPDKKLIMYIQSPKLSACYHGNHNCGDDYQLPLASFMPIFETIISSNMEQKLMSVHYQVCYANSTEGTVHEIIWKNRQSPLVFLHDAKNHKYN